MHAPRVRPTVAVMSSRARLGRTARRGWLVAHILCGVGWMGADVILAVLVVTAQTTGDGC